jgi:hypothetical protein
LGGSEDDEDFDESSAPVCNYFNRSNIYFDNDLPVKKQPEKRNVETLAKSKAPTKTANTAGKMKAKTIQKKVRAFFQFIFRLLHIYDRRNKR